MQMVDALPQIFEQSITTALNDINADLNFSVNYFEKPNEPITEEAIILTVSNHNFRVFISMHFNLSDCETFIKRALNAKEAKLDEQAMYDYLMEVGNGICGIFKRELGNSVPALGMSTPNVLMQGCFDYVDIFKIAFEDHRVIEIDGKMMCYASIYYTQREGYEVDVTVTAAEDQTDSGELELF